MRRRLVRFTSVAATVAALAATPALLAPPASAAPGDFTGFADPGGETSTDAPYGITAGPDGNLWFAAANSDRIGRITPAGVITTFADPAGTASTDAPHDITAGPDGNLWYTNFNSNRIGRIDPDAVDPAASITTFADPAGTTSTAGPWGITAGPDGNLWYTSRATTRIGRITPAGVITTFADPAGIASTADPYQITAGPDGNLWYTAAGSDRIGRIDPDAVDPAASITTFADPAGSSSTDLPRGITAGPDGNLWYTATSSDRIGRIDPDAVDPAASITTFADPAGTASTDSPEGITAAPDGNLWYTSFNSNRIGRIDPDAVDPAASITTVADPAGTASTSGPWDIVAGPDDNLWYTNYFTDRIVRFELPELAMAPANDAFADAEDLGGASGTVTGTNTAATVEAGEPDHAGASGGSSAKTVWYAHTATQDGTLTVDTCDTAGVTPMDTTVGVYTGTAVDGLTALGANDDGCEAQSRVTIAIQGGSTYRIAVAGREGGSGDFNLTWAEAPPSFTDVGVANPFFADVEWMAAEGISTGYEPGPSYRPAAPVTRQAMSAFMYRLAGEPPFMAPTGATFTDVPADHTFFAEIEWMAAEGISTGYEPGPSYRPAAPVTRQAMSAFMYRLAGEPPFMAPTGATFTDVPADHAFFAEVEWMAAEGISTGYEPGPAYRPAAPVIRQDMSAFMHRLADGPGVDLGA